MADNYLERRMEDLKAGRLGGTAAKGAARAKKPGIEFPWQPRRVAIIGNISDATEHIARGYLKAGCKVAVFDTEKAEGDALAYKIGIRFCHVDYTTPQLLAPAFDQLLKAWRGVDIIVTTDFCIEAEETLKELLTGHHRQYPIPTDYTSRLIRICLRDAGVPSEFITRSCLFLSVEGNQGASIAYNKDIPTAYCYEID